MGLVFGIFLYFSCRFPAFRPYDLALFVIFLFFLMRRPFAWKRLGILLLTFALFAGMGGLFAHVYTKNYFSGKPQGEYRVTGRAEQVIHKHGYTTVVLGRASFNGEEVKGKLRVQISQEGIRVSDEIAFTAQINRIGEEEFFSTEEHLSEFTQDIRYTAQTDEIEKTGISKSPFLRLNGAIHDCLHENMPRDEADVAYALLTGSGGNMDATLSDAVRKGGIAHIFAVSGLHIGILFSAVYLLCRPLKKWRLLPACALAFSYCALCSFTVSSLRAAIMCTVGGGLRVLGRKRDFVESISLSALILLTLFPAEWLSVGFRLSFGACVGLALFAGGLSRAFKRLKIPKFFGEYFAASIAVQAFTFPILMQSFGYLSLWGTLINFFVIPALPVLFLGLILCTLFSLCIPVVAPALLTLPQGMIALLSYAFSAFDFTATLSGFSIGAGSAVWLIGCLVLSERFRMTWRVRTIVASGFVVLFTLCVLLENLVLYGCKITCYERKDTSCILVRTKRESVLILDGEITLSDCEQFLQKNYGGTLSAVVILDTDGSACNVAAFLPTERVYSAKEYTTGLRETQLIAQENFQVGELSFCYLTQERLLVFAEDCTVEVCFTQSEGLKADLFVGEGCGGLIFYLTNGIIRAR